MFSGKMMDGSKMATLLQIFTEMIGLLPESDEVGASNPNFYNERKMLAEQTIKLS
jgi:hypothetical protein